MKINIDKDGDVFICRLKGEITFSNSPELRKSFIKLIDEQARKLILDLEKVTYMDSSGLATLVEILQKLKSSGGQLKLANLQEMVKSVFEITKLEQMFEFYPEARQAVESFK
ncbi:MAG: STAS domain-containing protein [Candidatus Aureabacteria bacterium]|nr:STAS domain-containing protein [Candidatus Auribacterota bacterium]MCK5655910.1 STAS domain-containing protein [Candidatus Auribacterota bacterium]